MSTPAHIVRSIFTLSVAQLISWIGAAVFTIVLPRYLGDTNLGKLAFANALTILITLVGDLGAGAYLTREIARDPSRASRLAANALAMRLPLCLAAWAIALGVLRLGRHDELTDQVVYIACIGVIIEATSGVLVGTLQGLQKMKAIAAAPVVTKIVLTVLTTVFLVLGGGPVGAAIAGVLSLLPGVAVSAWALSRNLRPSLQFDWQIWRVLLRGGLPFFVWQAALTVYGLGDLVLLSFLTRDEVVGWYSAAYHVVLVPLFVPTIVMTVGYPALSALHSNPSVFNPIARRALQGVILVILPMGLGMMLLANRVTELLGPNFDNAILPMVLLSIHIPLVAVDMVIGTVLSARDRQRQWAITGVIAAILNPLLNLVAIPYTEAAFGNGAIGAATITTLTEMFMFAAGLRLLPAGVFDRASVTGALRCVVAGAVMAVAVWLTHSLWLPIPILLGAVTYAAVAFGLGAISISELQQLRVHLVGRLPAASGA